MRTPRCDKVRAEFYFPFFQLDNLILPIPTKCYTIGTYFRYLIEWKHPEREIEGIFHEVKMIYTNRVPKKDGEEEREEVIFFYGKIATLLWDPDRWR